MKNLAYAFWSASYIIFLKSAFDARSDELWIFAIAIFFYMPLLLFNLAAGVKEAVTLRSLLIMLQLPFALLVFFRHAIPVNWYGLAVVIYLAVSTAVAVQIRRRFPGDVPKF